MLLTGMKMHKLETLTKKQQYLFKHALTAALASEGVGRKGSYRIGAVIADGYNILSAGANCMRTHPMLSPFTPYPFLHAETSAIIRCGLDNTIGMDLYVCRVWRNGRTLAESKPCDVCAKIIQLAGINKVYYTMKEGMFCYEP